MLAAQPPRCALLMMHCFWTLLAWMQRLPLLQRCNMCCNAHRPWGGIVRGHACSVGTCAAVRAGRGVETCGAKQGHGAVLGGAACIGGVCVCGCVHFACCAPMPHHMLLSGAGFF